MGTLRPTTRIRPFRFILAGWLLIVLFAPITPHTPAQTTAEASQASASLELMPPHPRLDTAIEAGRLELPEATPQEQGTPPSETAFFDPGEPLERAAAAADSTPQQVNVLAALAGFSDKPGTVAPAYFNNLIYAAPQPGRGSVRDYYAEVSYGQVDLTTADPLDSWHAMGKTAGAYAGGSYCVDGAYPNNCQKLAEDLVDALEAQGLDFSQYDNDHDGEVDTLMIIHAGPGAEFTGRTDDIWSHSWSLRTARTYDGVRISKYVIMPEYFISPAPGDMTIGVFAHELGHSLWGLPDLYDRDYSSQGVGNWSLMGGGSWNGPARLYGSPDGSSPAWPDAWSRFQMGWIYPSIITSDVAGQVVRPADLASPDSAEVYAVFNDHLGSQEYFLVENRQKTAGSYDEYLPGSGLLVWRVDQAMWSYLIQNDYECISLPRWRCADNRHYLVALEQADGRLDLERKSNRGDTGDPFAASGYAFETFGQQSLPDTSSWYGAGTSGIAIQSITQSASEAGSILVDILVDASEIELTPRIYLPLIGNSFTAGELTLEEGFENGLIPVTGWSVRSSDPHAEHTWRVTYANETGKAHSGQAAAICSPGFLDETQDETLLSPSISASSATLSFYSYGSPWTCTGMGSVMCELNVWVVVHGWGGSDDRLAYSTASDWSAYWAWRPSQVDLTPYLHLDAPIQVGFQYINRGQGAEVGLDDVVLSYRP